MVITEPNNARCAGTALSTHKIELVSGDLSSSASTQSWGRASAPTLRILLQHEVVIGLNEENLADGCRILREMEHPTTTSSGAADLAGLLSVPPESELANELAIDTNNQILNIATCQ
jgi:threonine dehydratase